MSKFVEVGAVGEDTDDLMTVMKEVAPLLTDQCKGGVDKDFAEKFMALRADDDEEEDETFEIFKLMTKHEANLPELLYNNKRPNKDKLIEMFYVQLIKMFADMGGIEEIAEAVTILISVLTDTKFSEYVQLRLRYIMLAYNIIPRTETTGHLNCQLFQAAVDFAADKDVFEELVPYLPALDTWVADWKISEDKIRDVYYSVATNMHKIKAKNVDYGMLAYDWLKKYLAVEADASLSDATKKARILNAIQLLVVEIVELPSIYEVEDVLRLPVLQAAAKADAAKSGKLVQILDGLFLKGTTKELDAYVSANAKLLQEVGVNQEELYTKVRVLTLSSICEGKSEIPLATIKKELNIDTGIEDIILSACYHEIATGKIDELRQVFKVDSVMKRNFGKADWQALDVSLDQWIAKITTLKGAYVKN